MLKIRMTNLKLKRWSVSLGLCRFVSDNVGLGKIEDEDEVG
jgi:hypothetical protein